MGMMLRTNHTEHTESPGHDTDRRQVDLGSSRKPRVLQWKRTETVNISLRIHNQESKNMVDSDVQP